MKTQKLLTLILVLQGLILIGQWSSSTHPARAAQAEIPNPAERQLELLEQSRQTNAKLDKLIALLQNGDAQVRIVKNENDNK